MKTVFPAICIIAAAVSTIYLFSINYTAGMIQAAVMLCLVLIGLMIYAFRTARLKKRVREASKYFAESDRAERPFPALVCNKDGSIVWFNGLFEKDVLGSENVKTNNVSEFIGDIAPESLCTAEYGTRAKSKKKNPRIVCSSLTIRKLRNSPRSTSTHDRLSFR